MSEQKINEAADRLAEFVRQARVSRDADPNAFYTVWTDVQAEKAVLSLDDIDLVLDGLRGVQRIRETDPLEASKQQMRYFYRDRP